MRDMLIVTRAAEPDALPVFREFIGRTCERMHVPDEIAFELQLACDEAAMNVIQHGYAGMNPGSIMLELRPLRHKITMVLSDFGHPFEPAEPDAPNVDALMEDQPTTGFGLYFIYRTMSEVSYFSDEQGNHLVLTRKVPSPLTPRPEGEGK
jgi:anti-sigma regulatory factor (Ser/Thr protein kinase)